MSKQFKTKSEWLIDQRHRRFLNFVTKVQLILPILYTNIPYFFVAIHDRHMESLYMSTLGFARTTPDIVVIRSNTCKWLWSLFYCPFTWKIFFSYKTYSKCGLLYGVNAVGVLLCFFASSFAIQVAKSNRRVTIRRWLTHFAKRRCQPGLFWPR